MIDRRQALAGIAALTGTLAARPVRAQSLEVVNMGKLIGLTDAAFYIAEKKGYFREQNLDVKWTTFPQSQAMVAPLAQGQLDGMGASVSAGIYNAIGSGIPIKIVGDRGIADHQSGGPGRHLGDLGLIDRDPEHVRGRGCARRDGARQAETGDDSETDESAKRHGGIPSSGRAPNPALGPETGSRIEGSYRPEMVKEASTRGGTRPRRAESIRRTCRRSDSTPFTHKRSPALSRRAHLANRFET